MGRENNSRPKTEITENVKITKQRLREIREKNRYTQKEIAKEYGVTPQTISLYEKCDEETNQSPTIPIEYYLFISKKFNVSIDWIMGKDVETKEKQSDKEKIETYGEIIDVFRMLYNTFGDNFHINSFETYRSIGEYRDIDVYKILNLITDVRTLKREKDAMYANPELDIINHIAFNDSKINDFLEKYFTFLENIDVLEDDELKRMLTEGFFKKEKQKVENQKISIQEKFLRDWNFEIKK